MKKLVIFFILLVPTFHTLVIGKEALKESFQGSPESVSLSWKHQHRLAGQKIRARRGISYSLEKAGRWKLEICLGLSQVGNRISLT